MKKTIKARIMRMTNDGFYNGATIEVDRKLPIFDIFKNGTRNIIIEINEPILDEKEKEYLSAVIKPFRNKVEYITKANYRDNFCYIRIHLKDDYASLPFFKENTMYKGMEKGKHYTLEELGL